MEVSDETAQKETERGNSELSTTVFFLLFKIWGLIMDSKCLTWNVNGANVLRRE